MLGTHARWTNGGKGNPPNGMWPMIYIQLVIIHFGTPTSFLTFSIAKGVERLVVFSTCSNSVLDQNILGKILYTNLQLDLFFLHKMILFNSVQVKLGTLYGNIHSSNTNNNQYVLKKLIFCFQVHIKM